MYENPSYNSNFLGASAFYWGENYCQDLPTGLNNQVCKSGKKWCHNVYLSSLVEVFFV
jgi:hypothetical protein